MYLNGTRVRGVLRKELDWDTVCIFPLGVDDGAICAAGRK